MRLDRVLGTDIATRRTGFDNSNSPISQSRERDEPFACRRICRPCRACAPINFRTETRQRALARIDQLNFERAEEQHTSKYFPTLGKEGGVRQHNANLINALEMSIMSLVTLFREASRPARKPIGCVAALVVAALLLAAEQSHAQVLSDRNRARSDGANSFEESPFPAEDAPTEDKRDWLRTRLYHDFRDSPMMEQIDQKLSQMTPERIDQLVEAYRYRAQRYRDELLREQRRQLAQSTAYRNALIREYQRRLAARRSVGFGPVITTLPEGASMVASALVSPDRRYVRVNVTPFFSRITGVSTFNLKTGKTRHYHGPK